MRVKIWILSLLLTISIFPLDVVTAASAPDVKNDRVEFAFPNSATFSATLSASTNITSIVLEYGSEQQTCGTVVAKAFPKFKAASSVQAQWTWDMRQSGSLPPGATIWWRWRYVDSNGTESVSQKQTAIWLDSTHDWKTVSNGTLHLHYYGEDPAFAQTMLAAGIEGLRRNKDQAGLVNLDDMNVYVYPSYSDMQEAILYEPSWTGGEAFPEFNIVILGISNGNSNWDKNTVIHELTHVLVGHFTFSCIGSLPGWMNEGLAMYSEGQLAAQMQAPLDDAIRNDTLIKLRSLNGGFSELPDKANLSYSESYSVIKFMIETYGQQKMTDVLIALRDAKPIDDALREVYGFDTDGLDAAWRQSVGAKAHQAPAQATAQPTPTYVPTYVPVSGAPLAITPTPFVVPTSSFNNSNPVAAAPLAGTVGLLCLCGLIVLVVGGFGVYRVFRGRKSRGASNAQ